MVLWQGRNADCSGLVKVLSRGSLTIDAVSLRLIEENLPALESCVTLRRLVTRQRPILVSS
jgi:hypothetical protein